MSKRGYKATCDFSSDENEEFSSSDFLLTIPLEMEDAESSKKDASFNEHDSDEALAAMDNWASIQCVLSNQSPMWMSTLSSTKSLLVHYRCWIMAG